MTTRSRWGDWLQTATGGIFYPLDPHPAEVHIVDIARSLSMTCRYGGHVKPGSFYSVAEHSVHVSNHVAPIHARWGLLHDASEAYSADIPRPLKKDLPDWKRLERKLMAAVCERYGLSFPEPVEVKAVDLAMTADERAVLLEPCVEPWGPLPDPVGAKIEMLSPARAEAAFLRRFLELFPDIDPQERRDARRTLKVLEALFVPAFT